MWFQKCTRLPLLSTVEVYPPPAFVNRNVCNHIEVIFGPEWIGCDGPLHWPAWQPDLSCFDYFFWRYMKTLVHDSVEELVAIIAVAAGEVRDITGIFKSIRCYMRQRYEACITDRERHFKYLLWPMLLLLSVNFFLKNILVYVVSFHFWWFLYIVKRQEWISDTALLFDSKVVWFHLPFLQVCITGTETPCIG